MNKEDVGDEFAGAAATAAVEEPSFEEQEELFRGELLKISNFLSSFRRYFSWNDEDLFDKNNNDDMGFVITPHDIESAINYLFLLQSKQRLIDQQSIEDFGGQDKKQGDKENTNVGGTGKDKLGNANATTYRGRRQQQIQEFREYVDLRLSERTGPQKSRDLLILQILERLQVWGTKDLTHALLMPPSCGCRNLEEATSSCWSKLLHLPGAVHFHDPCPPSTSNSSSEGNAGTPGSSLGEQSVTPITATTRFSTLYHKAHIQQASHHMCSLALPPNSHTWQEFARIAEMVSFLPKEKRQDAENSPCSGTIFTMQKYIKSHSSNKRPNLPATKAPTRRTNIYAEDFHFQPHDLVALWVRAQRNAVAMRHLIQLFTRPSPEELARMKEQGSQASGKSPINSSYEHALEFRGNHKTTRHRVNESKQVKALVEWAVMNQIMFQYHYMQQKLKAPDNAGVTKGAEKRPRSGSLGPSLLRPTKRLRPLGPEKADLDAPTYEMKLLRACYRYILRWFARRNLPVISTLFFSNPTVFPPPAVQTYHGEQCMDILNRCKEVGLADAIQERLREKDSSCEDSKSIMDRNLARIDRRVKAGKFDVDPGEYDPFNRETPFYMAVARLLLVWGECLEERCLVDHHVVRSVIDDFESLYIEFHRVLCENGVISAAKTLVELKATETKKCQQSEVMVAGYLEKQLLGLPSPWNEACAGCGKTHLKKTAPENENTHNICDYCDRAYAENCHSSSSFCCIDMHHCLRQYSFFSVDMPESDMTPDYRGPNHSKVKWEALTLTLFREVKENGELESAGLSIRQSNASRDAMAYVASGRLNLASLNSDGFMEEFPIGFSDEVEGCLITDVAQGSAGGKAGLKKNDVIIGLEFVKFADEVVSPPRKRHSFGPLSKESRLRLMKIRAPEVKLQVLRPDVDVLQQCRGWIEELKEHNRLIWKLADACTVSFCGDCQRKLRKTANISENQASPQTADHERCTERSERVCEEALNCRAVIRRLGLESYARPFFDEEPSAISCVSLRRLDAMMSRIIQKNSGQTTMEVTTSDKVFSLPTRLCRSNDRLDWAPEELETKPYHLLVKGFRMLFRRSNDLRSHGVPILTDFADTKALMSHFVRLFCAWCVPVQEFGRRVAPMPCLNARSPWLRTSCTVCLGLATTAMRSGQPICDSAVCRREAIESLKLQDSIAFIEECSALVGSTVLIFRGDPVLSFVEKEAELKIDSFGRPVEFVISFYAPPMQDGDEGDFLLLPALSQQQLQYLLDRCCLLTKHPTCFTRESVEQWISETKVLAVKGTCWDHCGQAS